jgi:hypothetical protein
MLLSFFYLLDFSNSNCATSVYWTLMVGTIYSFFFFSCTHNLQLAHLQVTMHPTNLLVMSLDA